MGLAGFCLLVVVSVFVTKATASSGLNLEDIEFCKGGLELKYPDLDVNTCMIVPQEMREKVSKEWGPPQVKLTTADEAGANVTISK